MNANDAKHTPGPWFYDDGQVYTRYCDRPESGICDLRGSDNAQADGELIAQAPTLLAERDKLRAALAEIAERGPVNGYGSRDAVLLRLVATQSIARDALK